MLLKALGMTTDEIRERFGQYEIFMATLEKDTIDSQDDALLDIYRKLRPGEPPTLENARNLIDNFYFNTKRYDLAKVGRYKVNRKLGLNLPLDQSVLTLDDVLATIEYILRLHADMPTIEGPRGEVVVETDDIDHFGNRRLRTVGELIQNQIRTGLSRMERVVRERMTTQDVEAITPQTLINIRPVVAAIKEFFGTSQLSQFMDQTNPLGGVDAQAPAFCVGAWWPLTRARRVRSARRSPIPLRAHVSDRDARRPEYWPYRLTGHLRSHQRLRFRRDSLPQGRERQGE